MSLNTLDQWSPRVLAALRIITALLFMQHGLMKLFAFPAAQVGAPDPLPLILQVAAWMEVIGAPCIILGLWTRLVAFLLSGQMAAAYWMAHAPQNFWPALNNGEAAIMFCFVFLYLVFAGPGAWSVDELLSKTETARVGT